MKSVHLVSITSYSTEYLYKHSHHTFQQVLHTAASPVFKWSSIGWFDIHHTTSGKIWHFSRKYFRCDGSGSLPKCESLRQSYGYSCREPSGAASHVGGPFARPSNHTSLVESICIDSYILLHSIICQSGVIINSSAIRPNT